MERRSPTGIDRREAVETAYPQLTKSAGTARERRPLVGTRCAQRSEIAVRVTRVTHKPPARIAATEITPQPQQCHTLP